MSNCIMRRLWKPVVSSMARYPVGTNSILKRAINPVLVESSSLFGSKAANNEPLSFEGRVCIVTGAGGGLGKEYALLFARKGASVVVNDLGSSVAGKGNSSQAADQVVDQIQTAGGNAVANYDSVLDGEKIVETALSEFGRVDILVNNAGILRDKSFARMSDEDWDMVLNVHLKGAFLVTRAAWPHFKQQNYGRIVMATSASALYGNFGQANYSAAKLGLVGLSNTLAIEGAKYGIHSNAVAPIAHSRMTEDTLGAGNDIFAKMTPELVAPLVGWLCHETCEDTGGVYEAGAGWFTRTRLLQGRGVAFRQGTEPTSVEQVRDAWSRINDTGDGASPESLTEALAGMIEKTSDSR